MRSQTKPGQNAARHQCVLHKRFQKEAERLGKDKNSKRCWKWLWQMSELKQALGRKMASGKGGNEGQRRRATGHKGSGQRETEGGRHWQRPVRRKMTSNNRKMTFRQQKTTKMGPNWPKRHKLQKHRRSSTLCKTVQTCKSQGSPWFKGSKL